MARRARFVPFVPFVPFRRSILFLPVAVVVVLAGPLAPTAGRQVPPDPPPPLAPVRYRPPVEAAVLVGFVPPADPYGPGNRGLEYATRAGQPVRAAAPGTVTFAGPVGGDRFVTVLHADRVRTTYGRLAGVAVAPGTLVEAGSLLGTATPRFIWTARLGAAYLDPAVLLAASGRPVLRLVPDRPSPSAVQARSGRGPRAVPAPAAGWALEPAGPCPVCSPTGPATAVPPPTPPTLPNPRSRLHVVPGQGVATDGKEGPWPPLSP